MEGYFKPQKRLWKATREGGLTIWASQTQKKEDDPLGELEGLDELDDLQDLDLDSEDDAEKETPLFPEQFVAIANDHIYFANDLDFLKKSMATADQKLADEADLKLLTEKLDELSPATDSIRQFGRVDRSIKFMYELLRKNQIPRDNSIFGKMLQKMQQGQNMNVSF